MPKRCFQYKELHHISAKFHTSTEERPTTCFPSRPAATMEDWRKSHGPTSHIPQMPRRKARQKTRYAKLPNCVSCFSLLLSKEIQRHRDSKEQRSTKRQKRQEHQYRKHHFHIGILITIILGQRGRRRHYILRRPGPLATTPSFYSSDSSLSLPLALTITFAPTGIASLFARRVISTRLTVFSTLVTTPDAR